ncbi:MAG: Chitinase [Chitinophagaceae bacterium]|nr:Chitinase [Chitinophagaceae bacterium]
MKKRNTFALIASVLFLLVYAFKPAYAQLPTSDLLVGYHQNWSSLKLSQAHANYNVICLAFGLPGGAPSGNTYNIQYALPAGYTTVAQMTTEIDALHAAGKVVLLSIGGATGPIMINSAAQQTIFENSITSIFTTYGNKIDGIDMDLETSSMAFGSTWTMTSPAPGQTYMVNGIKNIMATYLATNGKKMILTMAPEVIYLMGALSNYQITNTNGGAFLPILDGLRADFDLLHMQLYNAGGASGGVVAWNNTIYYDNGNMDFALAMNESVIKGFTLLNGKGTFTGIPASKVAFGLPATSAASTAGTGYVTPAKICPGVKYFKGLITKAASGVASYTMSGAYPTMRGLMTWSINEDFTSVNGTWNFAINFNTACSFSTLPVEFSDFQVMEQDQGVFISWETATEENAHHFSIQRSADGKEFTDIGSVPATGNSNTAHSYSYIDPTTPSEIVYYRIKEVDVNGDATYTAIKTIHPHQLNIAVYPNPSKAAFTLRSDQELQLILQNINGSVLSTTQYTPNGSTLSFGESLPVGMYILSVQGIGASESIRLVKE